MNVFEALHRSREPFDASGVLSDTIVQAVALTDFHTYVLVPIHLVQVHLVRPTLIEMHQPQFAMLLDGFLQNT
jgi:hypothetical protein